MWDYKVIKLFGWGQTLRLLFCVDVIPAKAGIHNLANWIPDRVGNEVHIGGRLVVDLFSSII